MFPDARASETPRSKVQEPESVAGQACSGSGGAGPTGAVTSLCLCAACCVLPAACSVLLACSAPLAARSAGGQQSAPTMRSQVVKLENSTSGWETNPAVGKLSQAPPSGGSVPAWGPAPAIALHNPSQKHPKSCWLTVQSSRIEHSKAVRAVTHLFLPRAKKEVVCLDKENRGGDAWFSSCNQEHSMELPFL